MDLYDATRQTIHCIRMVLSDAIPTFLLKEMVDVLLPYLTAMVKTTARGTTAVIIQARRRHAAAQEDGTGQCTAEQYHLFDICCF